jgi:hypothetical protein
VLAILPSCSIVRVDDVKGREMIPLLTKKKKKKIFFFDLLHGVLCCVSDPSQEENKPPAGAVELEHGGSAALTTVAGKVVRTSSGSCVPIATLTGFLQHVFQIVTKDRVWVMFADSAKDAEGWVKQLTTTIAAIPQVIRVSVLFRHNLMLFAAWQETSVRGLRHQRRRVENLCERSTHWLVQTVLCQSARCC